MCRLCETSAVYELTNKRKFCKKCFCRYFEKKVLHTIRKYSMLNNTKKIFVIYSGIKEKIIFIILKKISEKKGISLSKIKKCIKTNKNQKIALEQCLDDEAILIVMNLLDESPKFDFVGPEIRINGSTNIKPLYFCLDKEIELYAKINGIKGKARTNEKDILKLKVINFVNLMEKKHPEIKNAIVNAMLEIMPAVKKYKEY